MCVMNIIERIINEIEQLPEPLQREVLHFAHFLKHKATTEEKGNLMHAQHLSMEHVWDTEEDEVWNNVPVRWRPSYPFSIFQRKGKQEKAGSGTYISRYL